MDREALAWLLLSLGLVGVFVTVFNEWTGGGR
jgi:hypothetical protein